jgi:hypothetical protein
LPFAVNANAPWAIGGGKPASNFGSLVIERCLFQAVNTSFCGGRTATLITLIETVNTARGIDKLLFAGKERVAFRADLYVELAAKRGARLKTVPTSA